MRDEVAEIANTSVCSANGAEGSGKESPSLRPGGSGLFQRQLNAAGLGSVARKVAVGLDLEHGELVLLSRASLPLLGRIVWSAPTYIGWTSESVSKSKPESQARQMASDTRAHRASMTDPEVHPTAAATELPIERLVAADLPRPIAQPLSDWETFCRTLLATRRELDSTSETVVWLPKVTEPPDMQSVADNDFTGVDMLRAIALARLALPPHVPVVAPLATFGPKLAQVALEFGASHLGYLADSGRAQDNPLVADRRMLDELRGSCSPTPLREDQ
jgi:hypothetical protein